MHLGGVAALQAAHRLQRHTRLRLARCCICNGSRSHLWTRFWSQFEGEHVSAVKTLAHATEADIERGRYTQWEKEANSHADRLAKRGAKAHEVPEETVETFFGLVQLVKEAGRWAGEHESWHGRCPVHLRSPAGQGEEGDSQTGPACGAELSGGDGGGCAAWGRRRRLGMHEMRSACMEKAGALIGRLCKGRAYSLICSFAISGYTGKASEEIF